MREQLRWKAAAVALQPDQLHFYEEKELVELSERVSRDHYPLKGFKKRRKSSVNVDDVAIGLRRRRRTSKRFSLEEKLEVAHEVIVEGEIQKEVAKKYRVSVKVVSALINKIRRKPELLRDLIS